MINFKEVEPADYEEKIEKVVCEMAELRSQIRQNLKSPNENQVKDLWKIIDRSRDEVFPSLGYQLRVRSVAVVVVIIIIIIIIIIIYFYCSRDILYVLLLGYCFRIYTS
jgi:hypothetical protein